MYKNLAYLCFNNSDDILGEADVLLGQDGEHVDVRFAVERQVFQRGLVLSTGIVPRRRVLHLCSPKTYAKRVRPNTVYHQTVHEHIGLTVSTRLVQNAVSLVVKSLQISSHLSSVSPRFVLLEDGDGGQSELTTAYVTLLCL